MMLIVLLLVSLFITVISFQRPHRLKIFQSSRSSNSRINELTQKDLDPESDASTQLISALPLDEIYIVDSNLVIGYIKDDITGWKIWADYYLSTSGREFLMLPQTIEEISVKCSNFPPGFAALRMEDEIMMKKS
jgi:hypothetical protein